MHTVFWLENLSGRDHVEDLGIDWKVILEGILGKLGGRVWTVFVSEEGPVMGPCEHSNEPLVSIKCRVFHYYLSEY
jgi:hypothetical protein